MTEHPPSIYDDDFWKDNAPPIDHGGFGMTPVQKSTIDAIVSYIALNGYSPSYDELRDILGFSSKSRAFAVIQELIDMGFLRSKKSKSRSIFPTHRYLKFHKSREIDKLIKEIGLDESIKILSQHIDLKKKN